MRFILTKFFWSCFTLTTITLQYSMAQSGEHQKRSQLTFDEMYNIYVNDGDRYLREIFPQHIAKAKKEKDTLELASAYRYRSWEVGSLEEALMSLDTAMAIIKNYKSLSQESRDLALGRVYYSRGAIFYYNNLDEQATEALIKSFHLVKKSNEFDPMIYILCNLSYLKAAYGQESEAVLLQKKTLRFVESNKNKNQDYYQYYLVSLSHMGYCYLFAKETDSARIYFDKYLNFATQMELKPDLEDVIIMKAQADYYDGKFLKAKDTLIKYSNYGTNSSKADRLYYLGMIEGELGELDSKKKDFKSVDSIMKSMDYPLVDNINQVYQFLLKDAIDNNDKDKEQEYFKRLVYYDSLLARTQERLREITLKKFDLPLQQQEKSLLNSIISSKSKRLQLFYFICGTLILGLSGYYLKYRNIKKRLALALKQPVELKAGDFSENSKKSTIDIDEGILQEILKNLDHWEKEKGFLDGKVNQESLAKTLNTNSTYLSKVANTYKGLNFASYLKDLRITYAINHLKNNPDAYKGKSMIQIAELYGFNSLAVFNKVFKAKIGVTPGVFLKQLKKNHKTT